MPRLNSRVPRLLLPLLTTLLVAGCSGLGSSSLANGERAQGDTSLCNHQWLLSGLSVDGREHRSRLIWQKMMRDRPYFTCDKLGYVRGSGGGNPYLGQFSLGDGGDIRWRKPPRISRMGDVQESGELERDYLKALAQTRRAMLDGDTLTLRSADGATYLEFKRAAPAR